MQTQQALHDLLVEIHRSIDGVCEDLQRDQPALADALRKEAAWIPRPEEVWRKPPERGRAGVRHLRPLLYEALDEGLLGPRRFDALMVKRARASRLLRSRRR